MSVRLIAQVINPVIFTLLVLATSTPVVAQTDLVAPMPTLAPMLEQVTPAVVNISTKAAQSSQNKLMEEYFGLSPDRRSPSSPNSLGSGVIVDAKQGLVVTNDHVIEGASEILITLSDGREHIAQVIGTDPKADVALLKIEADDLTALNWADSSQLRVGDYCVAIGNPFGLGQTVTSGIVSALGRSGLGIEDLEDFIQTDASINPGNSGGALVNLRGELVGINTAIVGPSGGNVGIGFAIPANMAKNIVEQLLEYGEVKRGTLGIAAQALTPELVKHYGIKRNYGVVIVKIEKNSPAEKSGLLVGDIIVSVNDMPVKTVESVINRLGLLRLGEKIALRILRRNDELVIETTVAEYDQFGPLLTGATLENEVTRNGRPYIVISAIKPGSPLDEAGLQAGDIILSANRVAVGTSDELLSLIDQEETGLLLLIQRGRQTDYVQVGS